MRRHTILMAEAGDEGGTDEGGPIDESGGGTLLGGSVSDASDSSDSSDGGTSSSTDMPDVFPPQVSAENWREFVPNALKEHEALKDIEALPKLVEDYVQVKTQAGNMVAIPGENATDADWASFYGTVGRPESVDGYNDAMTQAGMAWGEGTEKLQEAVHKSGITPRQLAIILPEIGNLGAAQADKRQQTTDNVNQQLRQEWGQNFDRNMGIAQKTAETFGPQGFMEHLNATGMGNDIHLIKMLAAMGERMSHSGIIDGQPLGFQSAESAERQADELMKSEAYLNAKHPKHDDTVKEVSRLFSIAYPETRQSA